MFLSACSHLLMTIHHLAGQIKVDKGLLEQEDVYIEVNLCRNHEKWNYRRDGPSYPYWTVDLKSKAIVKTLWRARDGALVHSHRPQLKYTADEGPRPLVSPLALAPSCPDEEDPDCSKAHFALLLDGGALECEELEHTWTKPMEREILVLSVCLRKASAGLSMLGCDQVWSNLFKAGQRARSQDSRRVKTKYINRAQARSVVFVPAKACCDQLVSRPPLREKLARPFADVCPDN